MLFIHMFFTLAKIHPQTALNICSGPQVGEQAVQAKFSPSAVLLLSVCEVVHLATS